MPIVSSRLSERGTPTRSIPAGSSSTAMRGTTSPVIRTRKYSGHGLPLWLGSSGLGAIETDSVLLMICKDVSPVVCNEWQ